MHALAGWTVYPLAGCVQGRSLSKGTRLTTRLKSSGRMGWIPPIINDISTDLTNVPMFTTQPSIPTLPEAWKDLIRQAYPDVTPLDVPGSTASPGTVFAACLAVAQRQPGWTLALSDPNTGIIEGVSTTLVFRFKDDFVIRVRSSNTSETDDAGQGTIVDMRSRSRVGQCDLGKNAKRIRAFLAQVSKQLQQKRTTELT